MELRQLHYFLAVAEELSFSQAARRLNMAQPPLTRQIRQLEQELGVQLFERNSRRVELTEVGGVFVEEARHILGQVERSIQTAQRAGRGEVGRLTVAFEGSSAYDIIPTSLKNYREQFPDVELIVVGLTTDQQVEALHKGEIQVGFVVPPLQQAEGLIVETVLEEPLVLALPEAHPLAAQAKVKVRSLADQAFILGQRNTGCGWYDQVIALCRRSSFSPRVVQEVSEMQVLLGLVAAGLGVAVVSGAAKQFQRSGVVYRELQPASPEVSLAIAWREGDASVTLPAFLEIVRSVSTSLNGDSDV
ncbi:LysR family transcriptional regulator [Microcoleus sp. FACHB-1515]|uniref:LysR family transcriptional regulator n=1 Tax=Cyanophyceae TaxID=3028117 RepID=UPI0016843C21|nr:LysR family transcriptional regulator [Microcoleus sp. FACHB-1515]MBD2090655.1 LysR family transcriptional regulator [Microcoleus sp. FACHB-1515]